MWDLTALQDLLHNNGMWTAVETQGTLAPSWLSKATLVVVSPKSPGMGEKFDYTKLMSFLSAHGGIRTVALKIVIFSQQDIEFALEVGTLTQDFIPEGLRFLSLGNPHPPVLNDELELVDDEAAKSGQLLPILMQSYRELIEDICNDWRILDWKFMPQLHVLAFGNEASR